ncbi:MAG: SRPBCC domain-containing protein, partial [Deltaproteobacteria bacterium]|nr:SRPBCC domain-containing protein [Deltaproteobacteria bacterium]
MAYQCSVEIKAQSAEVWRLWASKANLEKWLAPQANVELREGGPWELFWDEDPQRDSTLGCTLLTVEDGARLVFEWQGKTEYLPLFAADKGGLTHVEVRFIATAEGTLLQLEEAETRD